MNDTLRLVIAVPLLLGGMWSIWWGQRLWRHPDRLKPETVMYRYFLIDWRTGPRSRDGKRQGLTNKRIRYYAVRVVLGGALGMLVGTALIAF